MVAPIFYVISWEFYLYTSDYAFMTSYTEAMIANINAQDLAEAERAAQIAEIESMSESYRSNSLFRYGITFLEIFPVGLVVALLSAAILKNPKVLPARADA